MHLTVATHYCGGTFAASKISVSGKLASCGMEGTEDTCPLPGDHLKSHCCDDEVTVYAIDGNYTPSFQDITVNTLSVMQSFTLPVNLTFHSIISKRTLFANYHPPDNLLSSAVSLADICVFRN